MHDSIKVALVEDDASFRKSIEELFASADHGLELIRSFPDAESALRELPAIQPDILLVDINLPRISGVQCVKELAPRLPKTEIMMLTVSEDSDLVFESLRAGATGYLIKRDVLEKLCPAIITLHEGGSPMSNSVARKVALAFRQLPAPAAGGKHLTEREEQILGALARGALYKEIAAEFGISFNTVRAHVRNIYKKLQVGYRHEAVERFRGQSGMRT